MACKRVSDIIPEEKAQPIEIRVLRKWISKGKKEEICYQFVDKNGDAIEATADIQDKNYFDSIIQLHSCYRVSGYMCNGPIKYHATVDHRASLALGHKSKFLPIRDSSIPTAYFNFANSDTLKRRIDDKRLLTDYIGRVERNSLRTTSTGITLRKILLQDERREEVEIIFWPEMKHLIGEEVVPGDVIAITSTTVTEHNGLLQLQSTYLTTVIINPDLPQTTGHVNRLKALPPLQRSKPKEKMVTVSELLLENLHTTQSYTYFKCYAKIKEIKADRVWYYATCSKCAKKLYREKENEQVNFVCKDDDDIIPNFMYCVNATITDETETTDVIFFNEGMYALLNISCKDMVTKHGQQDPKILPNEISNIIDIPKLLHLTLRNDGTIVVHDVTDATPPKNTQPKPSILPPATPNPKLTTSKRPSAETPGPTEQPKVKRT